MEEESSQYDDIPILPERVPVEMPDLPPRVRVTTTEQLRALSDAVRSRILGILQTQPATAKQIAERLGATPGAIGHHLRILEEAGLVQVIARRLVRGVVAKYYTRTARIFDYDLPPEVTGANTVALDMLRRAWSELAEAPPPSPDIPRSIAFPHVRLSAERARYYDRRLSALIEELLQEPAESAGEVYGVCVALFRAPPYLQTAPQPETPEEQ